MDNEKVTLVCVEDRYTEKAKSLISLQKKITGIQKSILFGNTDSDIPIPKITSPRDYSKFIVLELYKYIQTEFVLIVQLDGFVVNPKAWNPQFFDYDYIGAPWNWIPDEVSVGNGGFSLRSKKLLDLCSTLDYNDSEPPEEDVFICRVKKNYLESCGIKFCPKNIASTFSVENNVYTGQFGFHGLNVLGISK